MSAQEDGNTSDEQTNTYNASTNAAVVSGTISTNQEKAPEILKVPALSKTKEEIANEKKESSLVLNRIWKMVLQHPLWMTGGLLGIYTYISY